MNTPIYQKLKQLEKEKRYPFHMPGHKRKNIDFMSQITSYDITEITGYDNLHHPEGIIRESMNELKKIYGTRESWYLVNGTTVGILAAVSAVCKPGDKILISRNCHKAVYNIIRMLRLKTFYCYPFMEDTCDILSGIHKNESHQIKKIIQKHPDIKAVVITSPTYEGIVSDIGAIKEILNPYHIPLIVDEAHGAHMIFHDYFPKSAVECGADIVIQSTHKTLPSLTQTALFHLCTDIISTNKVQEMLSVYESSSPSYILMASAEYGVMYMKENRDKLQEYVDNLKNFRQKCGQFYHIHLIKKEDLDCFDYDNGKLVFSLKDTDMDGKILFHKLLQDYHIELEMENTSYCIAMTSICDEKEDFEYLFQALYEIDCQMEEEKNKKKQMEEKKAIEKEKKKKIQIIELCFKNENKIMELWETEEYPEEWISLKESEGRIAKEYVFLYPPGIPLLIPGEKIVKEMVEKLRYYLYNGYNILGCKDGKISVIGGYI